MRMARMQCMLANPIEMVGSINRAAYIWSTNP